MIKRICAAFLITGLFLASYGCGARQHEGQAQEKVTLTVFAAASLTETLQEIAGNYQLEAPEIEIVFNFDSSGTLKTQIEEGADCDIFLSASPKQLNQLDIESATTDNPEKLDFIDSETRLQLLQNKVVLVTPPGNPKGIGSFQEILEKAELIALGNEDVPAGKYSEEILMYLGIWEALKEGNKITYGSNVKEVTTQVAEGAADCGIIYLTDAVSASLQVVDTAENTMCSPVIYPAAILKNSVHKQEAKAFLEYLQTDEAAAVFERVGFSAK